MRGKSVNKRHPDYPAYIEKCRALQRKYQPMLDAEEELRKTECPNWLNCLDVLETPEKKRFCTQHNQELRALQKEYAHLFIEEEL